jgi:hypothetical protein
MVIYLFLLQCWHLHLARANAEKDAQSKKIFPFNFFITVYFPIKWEWIIIIFGLLGEPLSRISFGGIKPHGTGLGVLWTSACAASPL